MNIAINCAALRTRFCGFRIIPIPENSYLDMSQMMDNLKLKDINHLEYTIQTF